MSRTPSPSPAPTLVDTRTPSLASDSPKHDKLAPTAAHSPASLTTALPAAAGLDAEKGALDGPYAGAGTAADPFQVRFLEGDATNPFNFSAAKRWTMVAVAAMATLCKLSLRCSGGAAMWATAQVDSQAPAAGRAGQGRAGQAWAGRERRV